MGNVLEILTKESVNALMLPVEVQEALDSAETEMKNLDLYTHLIRNQRGWEVYQEVAGMEILEVGASLRRMRTLSFLCASPV